MLVGCLLVERVGCGEVRVVGEVDLRVVVVGEGE